MRKAAALLRRSQRRVLSFRFDSGPVVRHEVELRRHQDEDPTWRSGPMAGPGKSERSPQHLRAGPCRRRRCHLQWTDRDPRKCRWLTASAVVQADVIHERIAIEAGAVLEGRLQRKA